MKTVGSLVFGLLLVMSAVLGGFYGLWGSDAQNKLTELAVRLSKSSTEVTTGSWNVATAHPVPRAGMAGVVIDDKLYLLGGNLRAADGSMQVSARFDYYHVASDTWTRVADVPEALAEPAAATDGRTIWIAGGARDATATSVSTDVWLYDLATDEWGLHSRLPQSSGGGGLVRVNNALHYLAGYRQGELTANGQHWSYSLDDPNTSWQQRQALPRPRQNFGAVVIDEKMFVAGGEVIVEDIAARDVDWVDVYDPVLDRWEQKASLPTPRSHISGSTLAQNGAMVVVAGRNNQQTAWIRTRALREVTVYDLAKDDWFAINFLPVGTIGGNVRIVGDTVVMTGGSAIGEGNIQPATWLHPLPELQ